jgi:hypothetical protein
MGLLSSLQYTLLRSDTRHCSPYASGSRQDGFCEMKRSTPSFLPLVQRLIAFDAAQGNAADEVPLDKKEGQGNGANREYGDGHLSGKRGNLDTECL